jgi:hypothetical protein
LQTSLEHLVKLLDAVLMMWSFFLKPIQAELTLVHEVLSSFGQLWKIPCNSCHRRWAGPGVGSCNLELPGDKLSLQIIRFATLHWAMRKRIWQMGENGSNWLCGLCKADPSLAPKWVSAKPEFNFLGAGL